VKNIGFLPFKYEVAPFHVELIDNPDLWNKHRWRTEHAHSPHREVSDIWARYNAIENIGPRFNDAHTSVWYPDMQRLKYLRPIVDQLMHDVQGDQLGAVLITKIPAGCQVYPHVDGGWHALHYEKFIVQIAGNAEQSFCFENSELSALNGDVYWFNNQSAHWVKNPSNEDRISLIVCIKRKH